MFPTLTREINPQKPEPLYALCRASITFLFHYYLFSIYTINMEKREEDDAEPTYSVVFSLRHPHPERLLALPPLTTAQLSG